MALVVSYLRPGWVMAPYPVYSGRFPFLSSANAALPTGDDLYTLCIGGLYIPVFIPSVNPRDATMGALLELTIDIATRYHDCAARHRRLAQWAADPDGVTPGP